MDLKYQNLFSTSTGNKPTTSNLVRGEIALNLFDSKMFFRKVTNPAEESTDTIVEVDLTPASLAKLTDVQLSELHNGNVIVWDGTKWVNKAADSTLISDFVAKVEEIITGKVGTQLQAHSDQLDKVAALADEGLVFRKADGTIQGMTVEAADASVTVATDAENKKVTVKLPATGTAGSYTKVTTDAQGRVTAGENPTTLEGYGITDALNIAGGTLTGVTKYSADVAEAGYDEDTLVAKKYVDKKAAEAAAAEVSGKQGETVKLIDNKLEVASGTGNAGKVLTAGEDGQAATWQAVDFSNFVTLDGAQTIDGVKTFSATPKMTAAQTLASDEAEVAKLATLKDEITYDEQAASGVTLAVGGIKKGDKLDNMTFKEIITKLFYPYVASSGVRLTTNPAAGVFEAGSTKSITDATVSWNAGSTQVKKAEVLVGGTVKGTAQVSAGTSIKVTFDAPESLGAAGTTTFTARVTDGGASPISGGSASFQFVYPFYHGVLSSDTVDEAAVKGCIKDVSVKSNKTYSYDTAGAQKKCIIAFPANYGTIKSVIDPNGFENVDKFAKQTFTVTGLDQTAQSYNVYVATLNVENMALTFKF